MVYWIYQRVTDGPAPPACRSAEARGEGAATPGCVGRLGSRLRGNDTAVDSARVGPV